MNPVENLDDFPNEILIHIFKYLQPSDRRFASECCSRFLEIWLCNDFIEDRRIFFDKCVLDPAREPCSTFLQSQRVYRHIVFGDVIMRRQSDFSEKFWENITTVEIKRSCNHHEFNFLSFVSKFTNLKTIIVETLPHLCVFKNIPKSLELLVISNKSHIPDDFDFNYVFHCLKTTAYTFRIELNTWLAADDIADFDISLKNRIQKASVNYRREDLVDGRVLKVPYLKNVKSLRIDQDVLCDITTKDIIDNLEERCPALEYLSLNLPYRVPHRNWDCLKKLKIKLLTEDAIPQLPLFKNLETLKMLSLGYCYFVHEPFLNKNLKTFKIDISDYDETCDDCFESMMKSFPEIENLDCDFELENRHLMELATRTPKLKSLAFLHLNDLTSLAHLPNLTELTLKTLNNGRNTIETWPHMPHLRKFKASFECLHLTTAMIFTNMPSVEHLDIECETIEIDGFLLLLFFNIMADQLKRLKIFKFNCHEVRSLKHKIVNIIAENCKYLQYVSFEGCFNTKDEEKALENILEKHSSLRCINSVWLK